MNNAPFVILAGFRKESIKALEKMAVDYFVYHENGNKKLDLLRYSHCKGIGLELPKGPKIQNRQVHLIPVTEEGVLFAQKISSTLNLSQQNQFYTFVTDKWCMKENLAKKNIPMTPFLKGDSSIDVPSLQANWGKTIVVKKRIGSGSRDLVISEDTELLKAAISEDKIVEKYISNAQESSIESFIQDGKIIFTNITSYVKHGKINLVPGDFSEDNKKIILRLNQNVIDALDIKSGMTHLEFFLTPDQKIIFGEVAWRPPGGHIMRLISESYGFESWEIFFKTFLQKEKIQINNAAKCSSLAVILHPGQGIVESINGWNFVEESSFLKKKKLKIKAGESIKSRLGLGEEVGHYLLVGPKLEILNEQKKIENVLSIKVRSI